jgi:hypothetical protein
MIGRRERLLLAVSAGLLVVLGARSAMATLIIEPITNELPSWATAESTTCSSPSPARSQDEENNNRPALEITQGLANMPATTGHCNSVPQSSGGEWNGGVLAGAICSLSPIGPWSCLPREAEIILPAEVPFDMLRPV